MDSVLRGMDAEESVYLILGQRPITRGGSHDEITHQLDLGLEVIICEVVVLALGWRHVTNLRTDGHGLYQLPTTECRGPAGGPSQPR
jgi:hypothetical protein